AVVAIIEHKDANEAQKKIREINTGIMAVQAAHLQKWLPQLKNNNAQGEYYLTDIIAMAKADGIAIHVEQPDAIEEVEGINNRQQQAALERFSQKQKANELMVAGVTWLDPSRIGSRADISAGRDAVIDVSCGFGGDVVWVDGVIIEANCVIINSKMDKDAHIKAFSHIEDSVVAADCDIGPCARLRPGTELADEV